MDNDYSKVFIKEITKMSIAALLDNRKEIFERPKAIRDIIRDREMIFVGKFADIVPALERRKDYEVVVIGPNVNIIPLDKNGIPEYYSAPNFSKRGPLVKLQTFTKEGQIDRQWSDLKARIDAEERYKNGYDRENSRYVGWYWHDFDGVAHIVHPWTVIEGRRLEMYCHKSTNIDEKIILKKSYHANDSPLINVSSKVPSRSEEKPHIVVMQHLTNPKDPQRFAEWTRFKTRHECGIKQGGFSFRFRKYEIYCPHEVAAHVDYSRDVAMKSGIIVPQPFPMFTEPTLRLCLSALYDTIKVDEMEKGHRRSRPLSVFEINPILMDAWFTYSNKSTFFVRSPTQTYKTGPPIGQRKRMVDYDWSKSAPGMPFERY